MAESRHIHMDIQIVNERLPVKRAAEFRLQTVVGRNNTLTVGRVWLTSVPELLPLRSAGHLISVVEVCGYGKIRTRPVPGGYGYTGTAPCTRTRTRSVS